MDLILSSGEARAPSARELTRALGITAPSLYRHFSSTDELADALCARYFEQLGEALQRATVNVSTALERLHALGLAYVRHAAEHPLWYRFATANPPRLGAESDEILSSSAFLHLRDIVQELVDEERFPAVIPRVGPAVVGDHPWRGLAAGDQAVPAVGRTGVVRIPDTARRLSGAGYDCRTGER